MPLLRRRPEQPFTHRAVYRTDVLEAWDGLETRQALSGSPRDHFDLDWVFVTDEDLRRFRADLYTDEFVTGSLNYQLPLWHEGLPVLNAITGTSIQINGATSDWGGVFITGSKLYIEHRSNGNWYLATMTGVSGTPSLYTYTVDTAPPGGTTWPIGEVHVFPVVDVKLGDGVRFSKYPQAAGRASATAMRSTFRGAFGDGATLATYDGLNVLDKIPTLSSGLAEEAFDRGIRLHDYGAVFEALTSKTWPKIPRHHEFRIGSALDRQYFYKLLDAVKGRQKKFLLSTHTPDLLVAVQPTTTELRIKHPTIYPEAVYDYGATWYQSLAHRRLALVMADGSTIYRKVTATPVTNGDGTQSLTLDVAVNTGVLGNVARVSFLEQVRLDSDSIQTLYWSGHGRVDLPVVVVQR